MQCYMHVTTYVCGGLLPCLAAVQFCAICARHSLLLLGMPIPVHDMPLSIFGLFTALGLKHMAAIMCTTDCHSTASDHKLNY